MKFILPLLLIASISAFAQTIDSTEIKLNHYKEMYSKGMIDSAEFKALRERTLGINEHRPQQTVIQQPAPKPAPKISSAQMETLKYNSQVQIGIGSFGIAGGLACMVTGFIFDAYDAGFGAEPLDIILPIVGAGCFAGGVGLVAIGARGLNKYHAYRDNLTLNVKPHAIGLAYNF